MRRYFDRGQVENLYGPFTEWPILICPVCHASSLEPTIDRFESRESLIAKDNEDWEPESTGGYFSGNLACPRSRCGNKYVVAGQWNVDYEEPVADEEKLVEYYSVTYVLPAIPLMDYPENVPDSVREPILAASLVLLSDPSAAANRIRSSIEALLDCQNVRKFPPGKRTDRLTTHARIQAFQDKKPDVAQHLMAVKWIGNIGSHERDPLPLSLVLDGMEHFARALELLYDPHEKVLERRAAMINIKGRRFRAPKPAKPRQSRLASRSDR